MSDSREKEVPVEFSISCICFASCTSSLDRLTWLDSFKVSYVSLCVYHTQWLLGTVWCQPINLFRLRFLHSQCLCQLPHIFAVALKLNLQTEKFSRE